MTKPQIHLLARPLALLAGGLLLVALLALPAAASAQDPGIDQYSPNPTDGGNGPAVDPTPDPASGPVGSGGPTGSSPGGSPSSGGAGTSSAGAGGGSLPAGPGAATGSPGSHRSDGGVLENVADAARSQRQARADARDPQAPAAQQLSATSTGESGIGPLLWIALAAILIWAALSGLANFRRRGRTAGAPREGLA